MENERMPPSQFAGHRNETSFSMRNNPQDHPRAFQCNNFPPPNYDESAPDPPVEFSSGEGIMMDAQRPTMPAHLSTAQQQQPTAPQHHMHANSNNPNRLHGGGALHQHRRDDPVLRRHHHQTETSDPPPPAPSFPPVHPIEPLLEAPLSPSRRCHQQHQTAKQRLLATGSLKPSRKRIGQQQRCICQRCATPCWAAKESIVFRCPACRGVNPTTFLDGLAAGTAVDRSVPDTSYS